MKYLSKSYISKIDFDPKDFLTHIVVPSKVIDNDNFEDLIKLDELEINKRYKWVKVIQADIRNPLKLSQHDGTKLKDCLLKIINND